MLHQRKPSELDVALHMSGSFIWDEAKESFYDYRAHIDKNIKLLLGLGKTNHEMNQMFYKA